MISVALCTYNGAKYIQEQIDSILCQTTNVDEIVICDDGSSDDTLSIINSYCSKTDIIRVYQNQDKLGVSKNFQKAIDLCHGDLIFLSDQDDIWQANKVQTFVDYFNSNPNISVCFSNAFLTNPDGTIISDRPNKLWDYTFNHSYRKIFDKGFFLECFLGGASTVRTTGATMAVRSMFIKDNPFVHLCNEEVMHDFAIVLLAAEQNVIGYINEPLIKYRLHPSQTCGLSDAPYPDDYRKSVYYSLYVIDSAIIPHLIRQSTIDRVHFYKKRMQKTCKKCGFIALFLMMNQYIHFYGKSTPLFLKLDLHAWYQQITNRRNNGPL